MTLLVCWIVFPLVMGFLCLGWALLVERAARTRLPVELLLPTGFAAIVTLTLFTTLLATTARLTLPVVLAVAAIGLASALPPRSRRIDIWAVVAGVGVFGAFAAPVLLSGEATFAGYVKLDDTATFLALVDRALEHGRSLEGLAPSSYEATLAFNLPFYPLGSLLPLGIGASLVGQDAAWVFQPYLAFLAGLLGLSLYRLAGLVLVARRARAVAAFLAAQAALLYGYSLWGGIKELAAAALVALAAALTSCVFSARRTPLALLPLGLAAAALVGVLSIGAAIWLLPVVAVVATSLARGRSNIRPVTLLVAGVALLIPSLVVGRLILGEGVLSSVRDKAELGNLVTALSPLQVFGVWPSGDFRFRPERMEIAYVLIAVVAVAAVGGLLVAVSRRAWELPLYVAGAVGAAVVYGLFASPWIEAKAFAVASPAVVLAAAVGALTLFPGRRLEEAVVIGILALGVMSSNVLAFGDVTLAPRAQLSELETIGERFDGQGPALMTDYQPYGVRHFLRGVDAEGVSELRRRAIPLRNGAMVAKGESTDIAAIRSDAVLEYRTLVLRRSPVASRPPAPYRLAWHGRYYDVWQRPDAIPVSAVAPTRCAGPLPFAGGSVSVPRTGRYELWVHGSVRGELTAFVDGRRVGRVRHQVDHGTQYTSLGQFDLTAGMHTLTSRHRLSRIRPGEARDAWPTGALSVTPADRCG